MNVKRMINAPISRRAIESLGWEGIGYVAELATDTAYAAGWPDAETAAERLEWRGCREFYGCMLMASFEVTG